MRIAALLVLFAAVLMFVVGCGKKSESSTGPASPDVGKPGPTTTLSDKDRFQGVWKGESFDDGTTRKEAKGDRVPRLQVEGDRVSLRETATDPGEPFTATWDSAKNPKTLTLVPSRSGGMPAPDATQVWIYKFEGDILVVAFNTGNGPPPTEFKARPPAGMTTGVALIHFKKTDEKPVAQPKRPPVRSGTGR